MDECVWKLIPEFGGRYMISNFGVVKRLAYTYIDSWGTGRRRCVPEKLIYPKALSNSGYILVELKYNDKRKCMYLHRLLAQAFIPNPDNLPCVNHKDENKLNNSLDNLEWCSWSYNNKYGTSRKRMVETRVKNGTYKNVIVSDDTKRKLSVSLTGKVKSPEHRKHISEGLKTYYKRRAEG